MSQQVRDDAKLVSTFNYADVVKLVYTYALGAYALRRGGSSPLIRTKCNTDPRGRYYIWYESS